jgi:hypothetical protein
MISLHVMMCCSPAVRVICRLPVQVTVKKYLMSFPENSLEYNDEKNAPDAHNKEYFGSDLVNSVHGARVKSETAPEI